MKRIVARGSSRAALRARQVSFAADAVAVSIEIIAVLAIGCNGSKADLEARPGRASFVVALAREAVSLRERGMAACGKEH